MDAFQLGAFQAGAFQYLATPSQIGTIPELSAQANSGTRTFDLSDYFANADTYAIDPALEPGWSFDTNTGVLSIDSDDSGTFGPFTVTATNASGDSTSNAFNVVVATISYLPSPDRTLRVNLGGRG